MKLKDVPVGSYVTRPWYKRNYKNKLRIHVYQLTKTIGFSQILFSYLRTISPHRRTFLIQF